MMRLESFFSQHPVFHYEELVAYTKQAGEYNRNNLKASLQYHLAKQHIARIRRGYYAVISTVKSRGSISYDAVLITGRITEDAVIAYHSALTFHSLAYSLYTTAYFCAQTPIRPFEFMQTQYQRVAHPKALHENTNTETKLSDRQGLDIRVTTVERTLVDCLDKPQFAGGWEEIWHAADMISFLDMERVIDYALQLNNATTIAKVGFFLEQHQVQLSVEESHLKELEQNIPKVAHYMVTNRVEQGQLFKRWNLIVPLSVVNKSWEEPSNDFI